MCFIRVWCWTLQDSGPSGPKLSSPGLRGDLGGVLQIYIYEVYSSWSKESEEKNILFLALWCFPPNMRGIYKMCWAMGCQEPSWKQPHRAPYKPHSKQCCHVPISFCNTQNWPISCGKHVYIMFYWLGLHKKKEQKQYIKLYLKIWNTDHCTDWWLCLLLLESVTF